MFESFFRRTKPDAELPAPNTSAQRPAVNAPHNAKQREMIRMVLSGVLKSRGIPGTWISVELRVIQAVNQHDVFDLQLTVQHWHDDLMRFAPALQKELMLEITRFDQHANSANYVFSWRFSENCQCPHTIFPEPASWANPTILTQTLAPSPSALPKPKFDLPASKMDLERDDDDNGFAMTTLEKP